MAQRRPRPRPPAARRARPDADSGAAPELRAGVSAIRLGELAARFGCGLRGDPDAQVERVASIADAGPGALSFVVNPKYATALAATRATAVVLAEPMLDACPATVAALICRNPHASFARMAELLHPVPAAPPGIHPSAVVDPSAVIDPGAHVGPLAVIGARVRIEAGVTVGPHCVLEDDVRLGAGTRLVSHVTVCRGVDIGPRCLLHPGAVIGSDGFGYAAEQGTWVRVPQVGGVRLGADVDIGANSTVDRGAIGDTVLEDGVKLDNQVQIGHNAYVGAHTAMASGVGIAGSAVIGKRCQLAGFVGVAGHLTVCDDVVITANSLVSHPISVPGVYSGGIPAESVGEWRRIVGRLKRIDSMADRLRKLEGKA